MCIRDRLNTVNIRDFAHNKHNKVDDYTYGGGAGMLMQAEPVYQAVRSVVTVSYTHLDVYKRQRQGKQGLMIYWMRLIRSLMLSMKR